MAIRHCTGLNTLRPFDVPPELHRDAEAAGSEQTTVLPGFGAWITRHEMCNRGLFLETPALQYFEDEVELFLQRLIDIVWFVT